MEKWNKGATPAQRDVMSSLYLDYRFKGDELGQWWPHLQDLGFVFVPGKARYTVPRREDEKGPVSVSGIELLAYLDKYANPIINNTLQQLPKFADARVPTDSWGPRIRQELIFLRFRNQIDQKTPSGSHPVPVRQRRRRTDLNTSATAKRSIVPGADVFLNRKRSRSSGGARAAAAAAAAKEESAKVEFPDAAEFKKQAGCFDLSRSDFLEQKIASRFSTWRYLSSTNHSLLVHGAGSKATLIDRFADEVIQKEGNALVIKGFDPNVNIEALLMIMIDYWLDGQIPDDSAHRFALTSRHNAQMITVSSACKGDRGIVERAISISRNLALKCASKDPLVPFYLILHNIDGPALRDHTAQEALAALVSNSALDNGANSLRLVASVDHINAPCLLWDSLTCAAFRWMWVHADTFRPFINEVSDGVDNKRQAKAPKELQVRTATKESLLMVLKALAPRHTEVLQELARLQRETSPSNNSSGASSRRTKSPKDTNLRWVQHSQLFSVCKTKVIAGTDQKLRAMIKELIDQSAVVKRQSGTSLEYRIPYDDGKLIEILEYKLIR